MPSKRTAVRQLSLIAEACLADLFPEGGIGRAEASGVLTVEGNGRA